MFQLSQKRLSFLINTIPIVSHNNQTKSKKIFTSIKDFNLVRFHSAIFAIPRTTAWVMIAAATTTLSAVSYEPLLVVPTVL